MTTSSEEELARWERALRLVAADAKEVLILEPRALSLGKPGSRTYDVRSWLWRHRLGWLLPRDRDHEHTLTVVSKEEAR